jgi:hypothetical protein
MFRRRRAAWLGLLKTAKLRQSGDFMPRRQESPNRAHQKSSAPKTPSECLTSWTDHAHPFTAASSAFRRLLCGFGSPEVCSSRSFLITLRVGTPLHSMLGSRRTSPHGSPTRSIPKRSSRFSPRCQHPLSRDRSPSPAGTLDGSARAIDRT